MRFGREGADSGAGAPTNRANLATMSDEQTTWAAGAAPEFPDPSTQPSAPGAFRWSAWATIGWLLAIILVTFVGVGMFTAAIVALEMASDPSKKLVETLEGTVTEHLAALSAAQAIISALMVIVLTRSKGGLTQARMLGLESIGLRRLVVATFAILLAIFVLTELPQHILGISDKAALKWVGELKPLWFAVVLLVAIAPVSEELVFRGFIYGGLAPSRLGPFGAVVLTSAVWAVVHVQYAWPIMAQIFVYGVIFGVARWRTGSLWPSMAAHAIINLYAAVAAYTAFGPPS